jgi:hypothetical protein
VDIMRLPKELGPPSTVLPTLSHTQLVSVVRVSLNSEVSYVQAVQASIFVPFDVWIDALTKACKGLSI